MRNPKLIVSAAVAITAIVGIGAASAADLPARTYTKAAPMVDPAYNWSGFYIGVNAGGAWGREDTQTLTPIGPFSSAVGAALYNPQYSPSLRPNGFTGGGQIGYNYQVNSWVLGVEADVESLRLRGNAGQTFIPNIPGGFSTLITATTVSTDWLATFRGRVGWTGGNWLLYGTGGAAVTEIKYSQTNLFLNCGNSGFCNEAASASSTKFGWTAGAGFEYAFNSNWSAKAEYLFARFDGLQTTAIVTDGGVPVGGPPFVHTVNHLDLNIVRVGLNYKFGGPVVAKY